MIGRRWLFTAAFAAFAVPLAAQDVTSVTLFNNGTVLVRRTLPIALPAGSSVQRVALGEFDPASLAALDAGVAITRIDASGGASEDALLRRSVGDTFQIEQSDNRPARRARLVSMDPERWEWLDAGIVFGRPGRIVWPAALVPPEAVADVAIQSDRARRGFKVMYQTSGASWGDTYRIFLGTDARIEGNASLGAGTLDLKDVEVQLLAGNVGRGQASPAPMMMRDALKAQGAASYIESVPTSESVGDVHLYSLPEHVTFVPGIETVVPLFAPTPVHAERQLTLSGALTYYGGLNPDAEERPVPVDVAYRLERKTGTAFGDLPLPAGGVTVFDQDHAGRVQIIGQGSIGHTAAGEELMVSTGTAFDVTAKRVQTDYNVSRVGNPLRSTAIAAYRVTLQNAKDSAVTVEVREDHGGDWSVVESSVPAEKRSSTRTVFHVAVPAHGSAVLTYRLRVVW